MSSRGRERVRIRIRMGENALCATMDHFALKVSKCKRSTLFSYWHVRCIGNSHDIHDANLAFANSIPCRQPLDSAPTLQPQTR